MKVAFFTRGQMNSGSTRVRVAQYLRPLKDFGVRASVLTRPSRNGYFPHAAYLAAVIGRAVSSNLIVLQKPNLSRKLIDTIVRLNDRILIDIDDAVWAPPLSRSDASASHRSGKQRERFFHAVKQSKIIITGSRYLANVIRQFHPNTSIEVIPSSVDLTVYNRVKRINESKELTIGWIGNPGNFQNLTRILPAILSVQRDFRQIRFTVVSSRSPEFNGFPVHFEQWSAQTELDSILRFDIGLMPLDADERSLGRCGYKAIQYMAAGLPVIASPSGAGAEVVENNVTGFHASASSEWEARLKQLITDSDLRKTMGLAGRSRVESDYSIQVNIHRLIGCFRRSLMC